MKYHGDQIRNNVYRTVAEIPTSPVVEKVKGITFLSLFGKSMSKIEDIVLYYTAHTNDEKC